MKDTNKHDKEVDQDRRKLVKAAAKAVYVAPLVTVIDITQVSVAASGGASARGCERSGGRAHGC